MFPAFIKIPALAALAALLVQGCSLQPAYERPVASIPGAAGQAASNSPGLAASLWPEELQLFESLDRTGQLKSLALTALQHAADYRLALLQVEQARAQAGIAQAEHLPTLAATAQAVRQQFDDRALNEVYGQRYSTATLGVTGFELDFFGRASSLSETARHQYLSTRLGQQAARKALLIEVARQYLALRASGDQARSAAALLQARDKLADLAQRQVALGSLSREGLHEALRLQAEARQQASDTQQQLAQARSALGALTGYQASSVVDAPTSGDGKYSSATIPWLANLQSQALLKRFDVLAAEERLKAANASIGAARAAFFPSIQLSTGAGIASPHLDGLFSRGTGTWLFMPQVTVPLFDGGRNRANLDLATVRKAIGVASYEKTIQHAFKDMSDGLAERQALLQRLHSQAAVNQLAQDQLATRRAQLLRGDASKLDELVAHIQALETAQILSDTQLHVQLNLLTLYQVLYGADASAVVL